jgi:penicillin amidase
MHLGLRVPNLWYRARLQLAGAFDAVGASLPGLPGLIVGTNGKIAWGFTNSYVDTLDLIQWDAEGDVSPPSSATESIPVRGQNPRQVDVNSSQELPLIEIDGSEWLVQWTGTNDAFLNLGLFRLMHASNLESALQVAHQAGLPCQNIVLADDKGHIAWTLIGGLPMRSQPASALPLNLSDNWRWSGRLPAEETPSWINPANGRIWTANNRIMGQAHVDLLGSSGYSQQGRDTVIAEALFSSSQFNEADLLEIQYSSQTRIFDRWRSLLQDLTSSGQWSPPSNIDPDVWQEVLQGDGKADPASRGYLFLRTFHRFLADAVFSSLLGNLDTPWQALGLRWDEPLFQIVTSPNGKQLDPEQANWTKAFDRAFQATSKRLTEQFGNLNEATWGKRNQLKIQHPLSLALPVLSIFLDMPRETVAGDGYSPRAQAPSFGASQRMVVSPNHLDDAIFHMPAGQSGHFLSPFYSKGHDDWVNGTPSPLLPGKPVHLLQLIPEKGVKRKL